MAPAQLLDVLGAQIVEAALQPFLERLQLDAPRSLAERVWRRLLAQGLRAAR